MAQDKDKGSISKDDSTGATPVQQAQPGLNLTRDDLSNLLQTAIKAAQAPTAAEAQEMAIEKARLENRRRLIQKLVMTDEKAKAKRQALCQHMKSNGEQPIGGQGFSDGMNRFICLRCQKIMIEEPMQELQVARAEIQRLIDSGKVKIRKDGTLEIYENRMAANQNVNPGANAANRLSPEEAGIY